MSGDGSRTDLTPQESLFLFSGAHYSIAYAFGDEPASGRLPVELWAPAIIFTRWPRRRLAV